jgi:hypothetical protein
MKRVAFAAILLAATFSLSSDLTAARKPMQTRREPDMCVVPAGSQPLLPAKLMPGMGLSTRFAVTTKSEEARMFFQQGLSQIHSFWFMESERSCAQAAALDPDMAMAHWCVALSAASDYRPAFQLMRNTANAGAGRGAAPEPSGDAVQRTTNGAAVNPQIRAREAIAKAMALRDKVTERERLYIEAQAVRRAAVPPGSREEADVAARRPSRSMTAVCSECVIIPSSGQY